MALFAARLLLRSAGARRARARGRRRIVAMPRAHLVAAGWQVVVVAFRSSGAERSASAPASVDLPQPAAHHDELARRRHGVDSAALLSSGCGSRIDGQICRRVRRVEHPARAGTGGLNCSESAVHLRWMSSGTRRGRPWLACELDLARPLRNQNQRTRARTRCRPRRAGPWLRRIMSGRLPSMLASKRGPFVGVDGDALSRGTRASQLRRIEVVHRQAAFRQATPMPVVCVCITQCASVHAWRGSWRG